MAPEPAWVLAINWLEARQEFARVSAVGHRVVHGMTHSEPERVTPDVLQPQSEHPHGLSDNEFDVLFTTDDKPLIVAYHRYPLLIHRLTDRRTNHHNLHVRRHKATAR